MGNIINPSQTPYFNATLSTTTSNVTGDATSFVCKWDTLAAGSGYDVTTGYYTAPMDGYYCLTVFIKANGLTASHTLAVTTVDTTSGTTYTIDTLSLANYRSASGDAARQIVTVIPLTVGESARILWQISNGTKVVSFNSVSRFRAVRLNK